MKTKKTTNIERHSYKKTDTVVYYIGSTFDEFWAASKDSDVHMKNKGNNIFLALKSVIQTEEEFDALVLAAEDDTVGTWSVKSVKQ